MLLLLACILLALWGVGLFFHVLGGLIYLLLVGAIVVGIFHFVTAAKE